MIRILTRGNQNKTQNSLRKISRGDIFADLSRFGEIGVAALAASTPKDSSLTANSWAYRVIKDRRRPGIEWYNTNMAGRTPVPILIQYGHATGTGGYVQGRDFINPAMRPIFDQIAAAVWKRVRQT